MNKWIIIIILFIIAWFVFLLLGSLFDWYTLDFDIKKEDTLSILNKNKKYSLNNIPNNLKSKNKLLLNLNNFIQVNT